MSFTHSVVPTVTYVDPSLDLEKVRRECQVLVKSRAKISAGIATIPVPYLDVAVDAGLLSKLLPEISERFGLIEKKSDAAHLDSKDARFDSFKTSILSFGGLVAARGIAKKTLQGFGGRIIGKQVTKYIPFGGSIVAGTMSYMIFKKIAFNHIEECYQLAKKLQQNPKPL
ncbi:MAG: hypothetical protein Q4C68_05890 [Moraxella sp.]|nr:hypothetical protein [Moraxella sp.]